MEIAIKVEDVSKIYRLGQIGTGTISHDLNRWYKRLTGKQDPYLKLGEENKRDVAGGEYVYALQHINFAAEKGKVLGIIGNNGAGKSTLLKLLSRVTSPTTGSIKANGRIASLLEVGTGFHPELTGKENIYLNGSILGMRKKEITRKFDEIVSFSGVERYIDTPVKRYSSGMYVRLAFAVAAHLEAEILIIDEVLAVGDAEFQQKCLGKMEEVSKGEGRTVLFVSHNMAAVNALCNNTIVIDKGRINFNGQVQEGIHHYLDINRRESEISLLDRKNRIGNQQLQFSRTWVETEGGKSADQFMSGDNIYFVAEMVNTTNEKLRGNLEMSFALYDYLGYQITDLSTEYSITSTIVEIDRKIEVRCLVPSIGLNEGSYRFNLYCKLNDDVVDAIEYAGYFQMNVGDFYGTGKLPEKSQGAILFKQNWSVSCAE